mmetsp:Transcript_57737/g.95806  ORF Transcript_57737/g.95806 Transcript_57737/m.95806 type:complete len:413 (+) Transcript_57737:38-1276(+)
MSNKGYESLSQVEEDNDDNRSQPSQANKRDSMTDALKASAHRRQQEQQQQQEANNNNAHGIVHNNNLPPIEFNDDDDDVSDSNERDDSKTDLNPNRPAAAAAVRHDRYANNIGNIPNTSRSVTNCMNASCRVCTVFGIEIHIHILLPLFFVLTFLIWLPLILQDTGNAVSYILLIILFNVCLWETVLIHELGHCLAGYLVGGRTDKVLLWPLGGLAFTQPPAQLNNAEGDAKKRRNRIFIAFGGPLTHIPHMLLYGVLLLWYCRNESGTEYYYAGECPYGSNPFAIWPFWQQTIITLPDGQGLWFWYDFLMLAFMINFWLFVINLLIPAYPLDGSRIFANWLLQRYNSVKSATIYCWVTGIIAVAAIVLGATVFRTQTMLFFTGIWAAFQVYQLSMLIQNSNHYQHPLFNQT